MQMVRISRKHLRLRIAGRSPRFAQIRLISPDFAQSCLVNASEKKTRLLIGWQLAVKFGHSK
jgi:hypothetical protein